MEYTGHDFLEELLTFRSEPWESYTNFIPTGANDFFNGYSSVASFSENLPFPNIPQNTCFDELSTVPFNEYQQTLNSSTIFSEFSGPFLDEQAISAPEHTDSSNNMLDTPPFFPCQEEYSLMSIMDELEVKAAGDSCKMEPFQATQVPTFNMGSSMDRKTKIKKVDGQPSKNLMAERRRRKRLNDRLSMLRSVVPKISKMDRTSILGDTIDYMNELLERIRKLQEENEIGSINDHQHQLGLTSIFKDVKPNEVLVRNSPKFTVERRNMDTQIEMYCANKPGLLLSTVTTLEALGLEIQQCVISCFSDFGMRASCLEEVEQGRNMSSEDIKQALFRNAGYGGRCL
ncbi:Beta HLH protein 93 [Heracleum sosnowskyi]|uniref:Beta HLH protein 93 n=1 Tax=Heracleum sosnowskyi TaxID=360622 RepID=A0AAD8HI39_9APIA|nr:Beta HLH protein 93 [Heracleum sosnowskyi]